MPNSTKIGKIGQKILDRWGTEAGLTINPSDEDETGWDYFVEFPLLDSQSQRVDQPIDLDPPAMKAFFQVKTSRNAHPKLNLKLSNMIHAVGNPLPFFILSLQLDPNQAPIRAILYHVGADLIRKTKKRLRNMSPTERGKLHKKRMQINSSSDKTEMACNGDGLRNAILQFTGRDVNIYSNRKISIHNSVGYESGGLEVTISISSRAGESDPIEKMIDLAIGNIDEIHLDGGAIHDVRFGMKSPQPMKKIPAGAVLRLADIKKDRLALLDLKVEGVPLRYQYPMNLFMPMGISKDIPKKYFKIRLATNYFEISLNPFGQNGNTVFATIKYIGMGKEFAFRETLPGLKFAHIVSIAKKQGKRFKFKIQLNNVNVFTALFDPKGISLDAVLPDHIISVLLAIWNLAKRFNLVDTLRLTAKSFSANRDKVQFLDKILSLEHKDMLKIDFFMNDNSKLQKYWIIPFGVVANIGQYYLGAIFTLECEGKIGAAESIGKYPAIMRDQKTNVEHVEVFDSEEEALQELRDKISTITSNYSDSYSVIFLDDTGKLILSESLKPE